MFNSILLLILLALAATVLAVIRIIPDNRRFAAFQDGNFIKLEGPGIFLKLPGQSRHWVRLTVGDRADIIGPRLAAINGVNIPIQVADEAPERGIMRVLGFRDNLVLVGSEKP